MVFVSNTIQYIIVHIISWFQNRIYFLGFSTPEQGGKFKRPTYLSDQGLSPLPPSADDELKQDMYG